MKTIHAFLRVAMVLFLLLASGCTSPVTGIGTPRGVTIHFTTPGRTVSADWQALVARYEVTLTNTDGQGLSPIGPEVPSPANASSLTITGVSSGLWSIKVDAFDSSDVLVARGTKASQTLPVDSVTVPVVPLVTSTGTGSFQYQVSYPSPFADTQNLPITTVTAALYYSNVTGHADGDLQSNPNVTITPGSGTDTASLGAIGIPSGTYRLELTFLRGSGSVARKMQQSVNIWDNVTSNRWIDSLGVPKPVQALGESNFNSSNAQLLNFTATVDGSPLNFGAFSSSTLTYSAVASSATSTQSLVLKAFESQPGQEILLSTDGKTTFTALKTGQDSPAITLSQGTQTVWVRVQATGWFLDNTLFTDYQLDVQKTVPVTGVTLSGGNPLTLATNAAGQSWTASVVPAFADDPTVTWTSLDPALADIDPVTGVITPHLPGTVVLQATSTDGGYTAQASLELLPSSYEVWTRESGFWSKYAFNPPTGTKTLAGTETRIYALTGAQKVWWSDGSFWDENAAMVPDAPGGVKWLAVLPNGTLAGASETQVYRCDLNGTWVPLEAAPVTLQGIGSALGVLWAAGQDGSLWSWDGFWTNQGTLPAAASFFGGTGDLQAVTPSTLYRYDGSFWVPDGSAVPQTQAITQAFHAPAILVVR